MSFWTLDRVNQALFSGPGLPPVSGQPRGTSVLRAVSTDTRAIERGDLFVAIRGERMDAHDFLTQAVEKGAAAIVVHNASAARGLGVPVFVVPDTTVALGALGRFRRCVWGQTVIAIAGSNGKTSTKELVRAALGSRLVVHATVGNLNNQIGVPLTLLAIPDDADVAVVEIGTNHPGEVATLRSIALPNVAVVTSVGEEHLEGLGSLEGVLREESAIFEGCEFVITPSGQREIGAEAKRRGVRLIEAGLEPGDVSADEWGLSTEARGWFRLGDVRFELPIVGAHNVRNALLAVAVARACGVPDDDAARGIGAMPPLAMRSAMEPAGSLLVLNDAYNANPASMREVIATADAVDTTRPRVLVLGTMLELGPASGELHDEIARRAIASKATIIAGVGEFVRALNDAGKGDVRIVTASDADELWPLLSKRMAKDSFVVLKGSRGMRLERLIPLLRDFGGAPVSTSISPSH